MSKSSDIFYREFEDVFDCAGTHVPTAVSLHPIQYSCMVLVLSNLDLFRRKEKEGSMREMINKKQ